MIQNKIKIAVTGCLVCLLALFFIIAIGRITEDTSLSEKQIASRVEALYGGVVDNTIKLDGVYAVTFSTAQATYEVMVDEVNGRFSNLALIYEKPTVVQEEENVTNTPNQSEPAQPNTPLTEQQAIQIASAQFAGEIEDVDFENSADGGYYLIEIDTKTEEIIVQIHAITGKILSVSFDD